MMIQLPHFFEGNKRAPTSYPIGIGYLVSVLKNVHEMIPLDLWIENATVDKGLRLIENKHAPDIFCISAYSTQYPYYKEFVRRLKVKYPYIPVVVGGPGASFSYQVFLEKTQTDYCVIGEGEITLRELLDNIELPGDVSGIAFRNGDEVVVTSRRTQIKDLDSIPLPDRTFFDFERYMSHGKNQGFFNKPRRGNLITSRGCPYKCTFCSKTFSGSRMRSIENLEEEIRFLKSEFNIEEIGFNDELVLLNKKRAIDVCEMMKRHNLPWGCQGRINLVDEEILQHLKNSGCKSVGYGVESYTQNILDKMKKRIRVEQIVPLIEMTKKYNIEPVIQYMYGFPGESDESIENTYRFFKQIDRPYIGMVTTPLPGSALYDDVLKRNLIADEEAYLMKLTSGYNCQFPLINLTNFTDADFVNKRYALGKRLNRTYYRRHPSLYLTNEYRKLVSRIIMMCINPTLFFAKVVTKVSRIQDNIRNAIKGDDE